MLFANNAGWVAYLVTIVVLFFEVRRIKLKNIQEVQVTQPQYEDALPPSRNRMIFRNTMPLPHDEHNATRLSEWMGDLSVVWAGEPRTVTFTYENASGEVGSRTVDVDEILKNQFDELYLSGYCHKRLEQRTFLIERITSKVIESGRKYDPVQWVSSLSGFDF